MQKLFTIETDDIPGAVTAQFYETVKACRCRPMELRLPRHVVESFRIKDLRLGVEPLTPDDELLLPEPDVLEVRLGFSSRFSSPVVAEIGMDFGVEVENMAGANRKFFAEVWGLVGGGEQDNELARLAWQGYAQQLDEAAREDGRIREAFSAGYQSGRRFG